MSTSSLYLAVFLVLVLVALSYVSNAEAGTANDAPKIAKATIAAIMGRDPSIISVKEHTEKGVYYLDYIRQDDKTRWAFLCKLEGDRVIWAGAGSPDNPNYVGRWRTHPEDEVITYRIQNGDVIIRQQFTDGSASEKVFKLDRL